jgi:hypothetical protein
VCVDHKYGRTMVLFFYSSTFTIIQRYIRHATENNGESISHVHDFSDRLYSHIHATGKLIRSVVTVKLNNRILMADYLHVV